MPDSAASQAGIYPIGVVSEMTGVNTVTLRAWERRYSLLTPERTPGGRRLYSHKDIELIRQVLVLMQKGIPIGQMCEELLRQEKNHTVQASTTGLESVWDTHITGMLEAIGTFDEEALERIYNRVLAVYPLDLVIQCLLIPLMIKLGERWENQQEGNAIAEEHFFSVYMRNKIGARFHHSHTTSSIGNTLLLACLPEENHEIGLLLFALAASDRGYRTVVLGANMPLEGLPDTSLQCQADAIVLASSIQPQQDMIDHALPTLCRAIEIPVFIGGHTVYKFQKPFAQAGAIPLPYDMYTGLSKIDAYLNEE